MAIDQTINDARFTKIVGISTPPIDPAAFQATFFRGNAGLPEFTTGGTSGVVPTITRGAPVLDGLRASLVPADLIDTGVQLDAAGTFMFAGVLKTPTKGVEIYAGSHDGATNSYALLFVNGAVTWEVPNGGAAQSRLPVPAGLIPLETPMFHALRCNADGSVDVFVGTRSSLQKYSAGPNATGAFIAVAKNMTFGAKVSAYGSALAISAHALTKSVLTDVQIAERYRLYRLYFGSALGSRL